MKPLEPSLQCPLPDLTATLRLAGAIAPCMRPGFLIYLSGELGAGKTSFTRALLGTIGHEGQVKSPTFALMEPYNLEKFELHHFDFYRLSEPEAWRDAGFEESFDGTIAVVIEWPEMAGDTLPVPDLWLHFDWMQADAGPERLVRLAAGTDRGRACLSALPDAVSCSAAHSPGSGCAAR